MRLFVYEHCPYCVRTRLAAAYKKIKLDIEVLAYDDQQPVEMVGKKMLPILQRQDGQYIVESLDICQYLNELDTQTTIVKENSEQVIAFADQIKQLSRPLAYPREIFHPLNSGDFPTQSAKHYYRQKMETLLGMSFEQALANSQRYAIDMEAVLAQLDQQLHGTYASSNQFSYDDILLFPVLRAITIAQDVIQLPDKIQRYLQHLSALSGIELYAKYDVDNKTSL